MDSTVEADLSWEGVSKDMATQILYQGEVYLDAQLRIAIASDQRAITAASVIVSIATAIVAGTLAYWTVEKNLPLLISGLICGLLLTLGAFLSLRAARPIDFYAPGNSPSQWWDCRNDDLVHAIGGEAKNYQARIDYNERCLQKNANYLNYGTAIAAAAPLIAFLAWYLATIFS